LPPLQPLRAKKRREVGYASSLRSSCQAAPSNARVAPHADLERPTGTFGHHRRQADPPASKLCSPRESVHATDRASRRGLRARACAPTHGGQPGRCSPGFGPLQSLLHHDLGSGQLRVAPGCEPDAARKTTPHSGEERGASILRPRFSGTSGVVGWPPVRSTVEHTRVCPRHLLGGAPSSRALDPRRVGANRRDARLDCRGLKDVVVGRSTRDRPALLGFPASSPFLSVWGARGAWLIDLESNGISTFPTLR
jgi:hypothetical protein